MSLTNLCSCALMKDHKIINDLYLLFLRIMNLASFLFKKKIFWSILSVQSVHLTLKPTSNWCCIYPFIGFRLLDMNPKYSKFIVPFFSSSDVIFVPLYQCMICFVHVFHGKCIVILWLLQLDQSLFGYVYEVKYSMLLGLKESGQWLRCTW